MVPSYENWYDDLEKWPAQLPDFSIVPSETALLVTDMQNNTCHPEMGISAILKRDYPDMFEYYQNELKQKVIPNIKKLISFFREQELRIIYITVGPFLEDGSDQIKRRRIRDQARRERAGSSCLCYVGSVAHEIVDGIKPKQNELVINKNSSGAFNSSILDQLLRNFEINSLIVCGVVTNVCVDLTARDASDRGYNALIVEDACASYEKSSHDATLRTFARMFGRVSDTETVIKEMLSD